MPSAERLQQLLRYPMPYGKYRGRVIADLPGHYLSWLAREGFPKGELGRLLALMHEIDHNGLGELLAPLRAGGYPGARSEATSPLRSNGSRPTPSSSAKPKIR